MEKRRKPDPPVVKRRYAPVITMRMEPSRLKRIDAAARRKGIRRSAYIQLAISEKLEREEKSSAM